MKRFLIALAAFFMFPVPLFCASMENGFLKVDVHDDSGRIFLSAASSAEGPGEANARTLLFYDKPPSSFTAVALTSGPSMFGSTEGRFVSRPLAKGDEIVCMWETDQVQTTQAVAFIERNGSGKRDGVLIRYLMKNLSGREIPAGICVVFDTVLSEELPAHFLLSDGRSVSGPLELSGESLPVSWSTAGGGACLMGVLKGSSATVPDRALFANYRFIRERLFPPPLAPDTAVKVGFSYGEFSRNDSAVALVFLPVPLAAEREYRIVVGMCGEGEFGPTAPAPELIAAAPALPKYPVVPLPPAATRMEAPEAPLEARLPEEDTHKKGELDYLAKLNALLEEINRRLKDVHARDAHRGSDQTEKQPPPIGEEEINRLNERLKEIERTAGEGE
jgi:hypothetical protein